MKAVIASTLISLLSLVSAAPTPIKVTVAGVSATLSGGSVMATAGADGFSCSQGQYLTYSIKTDPWYGVTLEQAQSVLGNWLGSAPGQLVASNGNGGVGSTRTWNSFDQNLQEGGSNFDTLTAVLPPNSGNSNLEQQWTSGYQTYYNGQLTFYNSWHDLTVQQADNNAFTVQYYINTCASKQDSWTYQALGSILEDSLTSWINECQA